jgi:hypothetical protein
MGLFTGMSKIKLVQYIRKYYFILQIKGLFKSVFKTF